MAAQEIFEPHWHENKSLRRKKAETRFFLQREETAMPYFLAHQVSNIILLLRATVQCGETREYD